MSLLAIGLLLFALVLIGIPIAIALGLVAVVAMLSGPDGPPSMINSTLTAELHADIPEIDQTVTAVLRMRCITVVNRDCGRLLWGIFEGQRFDQVRE